MTELSGRALDAEIARVMFKIKRLYGFAGEAWDGIDEFPLYIPSGKPWRTHSIDARPLPWFSRDIAPAWQVAEHLHSLGLEVIIGSEGDGWEVEVCVTEALSALGYRGVYTHGPAPLAICKAALYALAERHEARRAAQQAGPPPEPG